MTLVSDRPAVPSPVAEVLEQLAVAPAVGADWDIVDEWGLQSFPASDPPANW